VPIIKMILWSDAVRALVEGGEQDFLARASLRARSASTASAFLEAAARDRPDLIVLPIEPLQLPVSEICLRIRQDGHTRSTPILALAAAGEAEELLRLAGCTRILAADAAPGVVAEAITTMLGMRLRRYRRFEVVLPVSRGRFFHEFLGYSNSVSEGGMGFETISRIRKDEHLPLRLYRNTEERPIQVVGRVCGVRPNIDTGVGYAVGIEFVRLRPRDRERLLEIFPRDASIIWGPGDPPAEPPPRPPNG
jgi:CheY-like chemotaxis protein